MKKSCFVLILFSLLVFVSCGGGSSKPTNESGGDSVSNFGKLGQECYPNETCDKGLICDTESNICIEDPENPINDSDKTDSGSPEKPDSDSDNGDSSHDNGDTQSDGGDTVPDSSDITPDGGDSQPDTDTTPDSGDSQPDTDTTPDGGDSAPDSDDSDTANDNPANLPECSPTSATPCIDSEVLDADSEKAYLIWSGKSPERLRWADAVEYCSKLDEGGFNDWQLPNFATLKTLLRNGTYCEVGGHYCSKFGDIVSFWTASQGYCIDFYNGGQSTYKNVDESFDVRCVRKEITSRQVDCTEISENAHWNTVSEVTQTWNWKSLSWSPSRMSVFSEEPTTTECRFKCNEGIFGSACNLTCDEFKARDNALCKSDCSTCGCKAGYVWVNYDLNPWVQNNYPDKDYDNQCVACSDLTTMHDNLRGLDYYCPGGDNLTGKRILWEQVEACPQYSYTNANFDACVCKDGFPPPPGKECTAGTLRAKPLIIN